MKRISIIGGGASGTLLAINLLRHASDERVEIDLVEKRSVVGRGVAFGTRQDVHLLNVPAAKMGAFPDEPDHFHRWLASKGLDYDANAFVPRKYFAEYLRSTLDEAAQTATANGALNIHENEAVSVDMNNGVAKIWFSDGETLNADDVVLAFGNFLPPHPTVSDLAFTKAAKYFHDPWSPNVEETIEPEDSILIIGTGLSMADIVMTLDQRKHRGKISAISTRGLLPAAHNLGSSHPSFHHELHATKKITELMKTVMHRIELAESDGGDWRAVIDSLRPHTQEIWLGLPLSEKKYFMQHLSRYWNVARHRMPPQIFAVIEDMRSSGRLEILKGRLKSIRHDGQFEVQYLFEGALSTISADAIINCIGSESNFKKLDSLLVRDLFAKGVVRSDALNFGLDALPDGTIIGANGRPSRSLHTLGTALKGILWESTAIPEIRTQAHGLALRLLRNGN